MRDITALLSLIDSRLAQKPHILLAIDGRSAAGKTSLSRILESRCAAAVFHMDDFFLPNEMKTPARLLQPGGNSDTERFEHEVLRPLANRAKFTYRAFSCHTGELRPVSAQIKPLSVIEGAYSLHPALSGYYDIKVFMDVAPDIQQARILQRNGEETMKRFLTEWIPLENRYIESLNIINQCDIVL
jgi:uridine kinase